MCVVSGWGMDARPPSHSHQAIRELVLAIFFAVATLPLSASAFISAALCTALLPLFRCLRTGRLHPQYRRDPGTCRVAIVGAGWSGLAIAARLRQLGVAFHGFEMADDVGGTWHPQRHYAGLRLHTPAYGASFADFPFPGADDVCPDARAVHDYLRGFAQARDLLSGCFVFGARVSGVCYDAQSRMAEIEVERAGEREQWGPYDLVVFASVAARPRMPTLPGAFDGDIRHASDATAERVASIASSGQRVVVVGAGKSACDLVFALVAAGVPPNRLCWLARRPYYFYKFERIFHQSTHAGRDAQHAGGVSGTRTRTDDGPSSARRLLMRLNGTLRGLGAALAMGLCILSPRLGWRLLWALDFIYTPFDERPAHAPGAPPRYHKWSRAPAFHMGILDGAQRRVLSEGSGNYSLVLGDEPIALDGGCIVMRSGARIECDCLLWATGFDTGASDLALSKVEQRARPRQAREHAQEPVYISATAYVDETGAGSASVGTAWPLELSNDEPLFEHVLCPRLPCLALPAHFFVGPGPEGAREAAEYLVYHLCVRPMLSEKTMVAEAGAQWCKQPVRQHLLFADGFWSNMMLVQMDLINAGILPMATGLSRLIDFWVRNRLPPRELGLLPAHAEPERPHSRHASTSRGCSRSEPLTGDGATR